LTFLTFLERDKLIVAPWRVVIDNWRRWRSVVVPRTLQLPSNYRIEHDR
jgi:hypothetical protein